MYFTRDMVDSSVKKAWPHMFVLPETGLDSAISFAGLGELNS